MCRGKSDWVVGFPTNHETFGKVCIICYWPSLLVRPLGLFLFFILSWFSLFRLLSSLISCLFHSCRYHAQVFRTTLVHAIPILYIHTDWNLILDCFLSVIAVIKILDWSAAQLNTELMYETTPDACPEHLQLFISQPPLVPDQCLATLVSVLLKKKRLKSAVNCRRPQKGSELTHSLRTILINRMYYFHDLNGKFYATPKRDKTFRLRTMSCCIPLLEISIYHLCPRAARSVLFSLYDWPVCSR